MRKVLMSLVASLLSLALAQGITHESLSTTLRENMISVFTACPYSIGDGKPVSCFSTTPTRNPMVQEVVDAILYDHYAIQESSSWFRRGYQSKIVYKAYTFREDGARFRVIVWIENPATAWIVVEPV